MDQVTIIVPASSANVGLGYDVWCLGLTRPTLRVTCARQAGGVVIEAARSPAAPPEGRVLGMAGQTAVQRFLKDRGIRGGARLTFEDEGYPVGGLGRSGAEAVGAVMAAAIIYEQRLTRTETVLAAARGEPGEHKDNVAASTNGRFNVIAVSPLTGTTLVDVYPVPEDLGIAIGISPHSKTQGTSGMREVLSRPVSAADFVAQGGLVSSATAALVTGNTARFLELVWGDRFHEPRRADAGGYGSFNAADLAGLKRRLYREFQIALNMSGAGPNIQLLYRKPQYPGGINGLAADAIAGWFKEHGLDLAIRPTEIATEGAYDYAQRQYGYAPPV